jgi:dolichol kinase
VASDPSLPYAGELGRKALHLLALSIPLGMWWVGMPLALYLLAPAALLAVAADVVRSYSATFNTLIRWIFGPLMRPEELPEAGTEVRFNGATCVLVGAVLMVLLFPLRVAVPVLAMAMLADAAAALVGRRVGRIHWGSLSATVEGTAAFIGTGLTIMAWFPAVAFGPAAAGVVVGAVIEALPMPVNDNIRVPVVSALVVVGAEALLFGRPVPLFTGFLS